jgi:hypothetical protein
MRKLLIITLLMTGLTVLSGQAYAGAMAADEPMEPAPDPKKKKAGEECKSSDECQKHHACSKNGEKNVCTAPTRPKLPPGVVT